MIGKIAHKIFSIIKHAVFDAHYKLFGFTYSHGLGESTILVYHGVAKEAPRKYNDRYVSCKELEIHIKYFQKHFNLISFEEFKKNQLDAERHNVLLSFDDGYLNNINLALPILKKHNVPALFCVTPHLGKQNEILWPDHLDITANEFDITLVFNEEEFRSKAKTPWGRKAYYASNGLSLKSELKSATKRQIQNVIGQIDEKIERNLLEPFSNYWKRMSEDDLRQLSQERLINIASHSLSHYALDTLNGIELENELKNSKTILEAYVDSNIDAFAFPFGTYSDTSISTAIDTGYKYLLAADELHSITSAVYSRMTINPYLSGPNLVKKITEGG